MLLSQKGSGRRCQQTAEMRLACPSLPGHCCYTCYRPFVLQAPPLARIFQPSVAALQPAECAVQTVQELVCLSQRFHKLDPTCGQMQGKPLSSPLACPYQISSEILWRAFPTHHALQQEITDADKAGMDASCLGVVQYELLRCISTACATTPATQSFHLFTTPKRFTCQECYPCSPPACCQQRPSFKHRLAEQKAITVVHQFLRGVL